MNGPSALKTKFWVDWNSMNSPLLSSAWGPRAAAGSW